MYLLVDYGRMVADRIRTDAYTLALQQSVKPDSVVLDIGTGTGIFALLACKFGAARVYAVEPEDIVEVGREIAKDNGFSDRIEFIQGYSTDVTLPEPVDLIVSDIHGTLPLFGKHLIYIADARRRLLAPDGLLIPGRETIWTCVVDAPDLYNQFIAPWDNNGYDLDMSAARRLVTNGIYHGRITPKEVLLEPRRWAFLDYGSLESPDVSGTVTWIANTIGTGHGLAIWFDSELTNTVRLSNAPGDPPLIYGSAFVPWPRAIPIERGDRVTVDIKATLVSDGYVWRWNTRIFPKGRREACKNEFQQSSILASPLSRSRLRFLASNYIPPLAREKEVDEFILMRLDGKTSIGTISQQLETRFPKYFACSQDALTRVAETAMSYRKRRK